MIGFVVARVEGVALTETKMPCRLEDGLVRAKPIAELTGSILRVQKDNLSPNRNSELLCSDQLWVAVALSRICST